MPLLESDKMVFAAVAMMVLAVVLFFVVLTGDGPVRGGQVFGALLFVGLAYGMFRFARWERNKEVARAQRYQERRLEEEVRSRLERERREREAEQRRREEADRKKERERALDELVAEKKRRGKPKKPKAPPRPASFTCSGCGAVGKTADDGSMVCEYCGNPNG